MKKLVLSLAVSCLILGLGFMSGCEDSTTKVLGPKILTVTASPATISQGGVTTLTVSAKGKGTLSYLWNTSEGELQNASSDTVTWTAPDETGLFTISIIVTDAEGASVNAVNVNVSDYIAAVSPFYVGNDNCAQCHSSTSGTWHNSGHGEALATLQAIGRDQTPSCLGCHTVGYDVTIDNGGYDEVPVERLANVGCETCHGPGSAHNGNPAGISTSYEAETCGTCHEDEHHPYIEEWEESAHAGSDLSAGGFVANNDNCARCHVAEVFVEYLKTGVAPPVATLATKNPITCQACHNPHSATLRTANVDLICGDCHVANSIADVNNPGAPHHPQWNMLHGTDGLEYAGQTYEHSPHRFVVAEKCATCHVSTVPFMSGNAAKTGHTFEPELRSCTGCHPGAADFDVNGVQTEIQSLITQLQAELAMASGADSLTASFKQAVYNLEFVEADASHGVHNYKYAKGLLETSINDFTPTPDRVNPESEPDIRRRP